MAKKFRVMAVADIHGDSKLVGRLAEDAERENVNLVVLCGDVTSQFKTKNIIQPFKDKNLPVLILPGNHDSPDSIEFLSEFYKIKNLHENYAIYEGIGFFGAGFATNIGPWAMSEGNMGKTLEKAHSKLNGIERKIMVTHMHPSGSVSEFSGVEGSKAVREAIRKFSPDVLLHGHIHEAGGVSEDIYDTKVINVSRRAAIIDIE